MASSEAFVASRAVKEIDSPLSPQASWRYQRLPDGPADDSALHISIQRWSIRIGSSPIRRRCLDRNDAVVQYHRAR